MSMPFLCKKGKESSNAMFMIRSENHNYNPSDMDWAKGEPFHGNLAMAKQGILRSQQCKSAQHIFVAFEELWGGYNDCKESSCRSGSPSSNNCVGCKTESKVRHSEMHTAGKTIILTV
jgi:hypothetical protein